MSNVQHHSKSDGWKTPESIINMVRHVLGHIDLDPASDPVTNQKIGASLIYTKEQCGLKHKWPDHITVYLNPPGGKIKNKSKSILFWSKLMSHLMHGKLTHAIYTGFSIEQLATSQRKGVPSILQVGTICVPAKRIQFVGDDSSKQAPTHSNVFVYIPGTVDKTWMFKQVFSQLGDIK